MTGTLVQGKIIGVKLDNGSTYGGGSCYRPGPLQLQCHVCINNRDTTWRLSRFLIAREAQHAFDWSVPSYRNFRIFVISLWDFIAGQGQIPPEYIYVSYPSP
jgi:hypothetical protein